MLRRHFLALLSALLPVKWFRRETTAEANRRIFPVGSAVVVKKTGSGGYRWMVETWATNEAGERVGPKRLVGIDAAGYRVTKVLDGA